MHSPCSQEVLSENNHFNYNSNSNSDARKHTLFSVIKKLTEEALEKKNEGLAVISNNFGKWSWELNELLDQLDKSWVLNTYCKMVQISDELCEGPQKNIRNVLKKTCCFNYPCMLTMFKKHVDRLLPFLEMFCTDHGELFVRVVGVSLPN